MKKAFFTCAFIFLFLGHFQAQFAIYTFTQTSGTYNAISGGTVFGTQTTDDEVFVNPAAPGGNGIGTNGVGMPIGFNFFINGNIYDRVGISANGYIMLGQTTATPSIVSQIANQYAPISSTTIANPNLQHKVVAFGCDIQAQGPSEIRMQTIGTSPNQTLVVQWFNYRKYNNTGDNYNFQIRLCETTNVIEVIYGNFVNNSTSGIAQVGLRGSQISDFSTRYVNAINVWSASAAGISATTTANFNSSLLPSSGQIYRWLPPPPCTTTPVSNTVQASLSTICPGGSSSLSLSYTYSLSGITYNWMASTTSSTGPFTNISGAGSNYYNPSNISTSTWYQCAIACVNGGNAIISAPKQISTTGSIISNIPYTEDFENILVNNQLPNCSWAASSPTVACQTYTSPGSFNRVGNSGSKFAAFQNGNYPNGNYFYSNGLQLYSGITYSASVWYINDGLNGWAEFSMCRSSAQNSINLTTIATAPTIGGNVLNFAYAPLSNTFTVPTSGVYYLVIKCRALNTAQYFSFDDVSVTIPCSLNQPSLSVSASSPTVCSGNSTTLTAIGANSYSWAGGPTTSTYVVTPGTTGIYSVTTTNTLSGCSKTQTQSINVLPTPYVGIISSTLTVCSGQTLTLASVGASTYNWNTGATNSLIVVSPSVTTVYSVSGTDANGCSATSSLQITTLANPTITAAANPTQICAGETSTLTALGGNSYSWISGSNYLVGTTLVVKPSLTSFYTITGTASNGCVSNTTLSLSVLACTAIKNHKTESLSLKIYPVPCTDELFVELKEDTTDNLTIYNVYGQVVLSFKDCKGAMKLNIANLANGLYFISLESGGNAQFIKAY